MAGNPYESPKTRSASNRHGWRLPFDIGRFVGRYLQVLAGISVVSMAVDLLLFDRLQFDLSFIFFYWAGVCLIRHSSTARKWVIGISGLVISLSCGMVVLALAIGTEGMTVTIGVGQRIDNPPIAYVVGVAVILVLLPGIPFVLLLTQQAKSEFTSSEDPA